MCTKLSNTIFSLGTNCCPVVCDVASTSEHRRLYWNKSFLLWYLFSFRIIYLKHLVNICIKTPAVPVFPVFGYFFVTCIYVPTKYMKFKRLFKKCLFQSFSSMLLQSFLSKGKNNQNPYVFDWLQSFMITCNITFLIESFQFKWLSWKRSRNCRATNDASSKYDHRHCCITFEVMRDFSLVELWDLRGKKLFLQPENMKGFK